MTQTILITGATGTQGTSTIKALVADHPNITVHALVRDPSSSKSKTLTSLSNHIKLFTGTFDDIPSIASAAKSCTSAFINVVPSFTDPSAESRHCTNILSALRDISTIKHIVYSSVNGCADPTNPNSFKSLDESSWMYNYFRSKHGNEVAITNTAKQQDWNWTILQPAAFLSNLVSPFSEPYYPQMASEHKIVTALPRECKLSYLDPEDIGRFAAEALTSSDPKLGKRIPLASLHLTLQEVVDSMNASLKKWGRGVQVRVEYMSKEEAERQKGTNPFVGSSLFLAENPALVDLEEVRGYGVELGSLEGFWEREKKGVEKAVGL